MGMTTRRAFSLVLAALLALPGAAGAAGKIKTVSLFPATPPRGHATALSLGVRDMPAALAAAAPAPFAVSADAPGAWAALSAVRFDGASFNAPADEAVFAAAPESRRSSGLDPPSEDEIAAAFSAARPGSKAGAFFDSPTFAALSAELLSRYTFQGRGFIEDLAERVSPFDSEGQAVLAAAVDIMALHDAASAGAPRRFVELAGAWAAFKDAVPLKDRAPRFMPPSPLVEGEYWDMAAGLNAGHSIRNEPGRYVFFDRSPYAAAYLRTAARLAGAAGVEVREEDVRAITKPTKPLAVLRTKNAVAYVAGFERKLETMADWIAPGGQLVIQNDPHSYQRKVIIDKHGPLALRLLSEGWKFEFGFAGSRGHLGDYVYDTLIFTKPQGGAASRTKAETQKAWRAYLDAVAYANRRS